MQFPKNNPLRPLAGLLSKLRVKSIFGQHTPTIAIVAGVWFGSSFVFAFFYSDQLTLLCSGLASPTCLRASLLLNPRVNKRLSDFNGTTPLIYLLDRSGQNSNGQYSEEREAKSLSLLLDAGAEPNQPDDDGWSPLMVAAANGRLQLVKLLVDAGANVNRRAKARSTLDGMTALMAASHHGHSQVVQYLLEAGAKPDLKSSKGLDAATIAALEGHDTVVTLFKQAGAEPDPDLLRGMDIAEELVSSTELERQPASHRRVIRSRRPEE